MSPEQSMKADTPWRSGSARILLATLLLLLVSVACSVGQAVGGRSTGVEPTPTKTPRPTFTPLPGALTPAGTAGLIIRGTLPPGVTAPAPAATGATATARGTPGAVVVGSTNLIIYATDTPRVVPTATPTRTRTARPVTPTAAVTPLAVINSDTLNGRRGPGTNYERIGQAKKGDELLILGRTADGTWLQVCCMANQPVWVATELVTLRFSVEILPVVTPPPLPPPVQPTPRQPTSPLPPPTPIPTRGLPFDIGRGPEFPIKRDNGILTIWVKVYEGPADNQSPVGGYILKVKRDGVDVSNNIESFGDRPFDQTRPVEGNYQYNLKFEMNNAGEADWEIFLARPGGFQVSPVTKFTTKGDSYRNLVVFIGYFLAR